MFIIGGTLTSDIIDICHRNNLAGYLVAMYIEKVVYVIKKIGFGENFIS